LLVREPKSDRVPHEESVWFEVDTEDEMRLE
jgi:hypothetical protein